MNFLILILTIITGLFASSVTAAGKAVYRNNCKFPIFFFHAGDGWADRSPKTLVSQMEFHEGFIGPRSGKPQGISVKFSKSPKLIRGGPILQFEYTFDPLLAHSFAWDSSHLDGKAPGEVGSSPFGEVNVKFTPVGGGRRKERPTCSPVLCRRGEVCRGSYQWPKDDKQMRTCDLKIESLVIDFCAADATMRGKRELAFEA